MDKLKKTLFIWIGTFVSIIILIIYILYDNTIKCNIFQVLLNLSYSYLAAVIFYIFQVLIPNKKKEENAFELLKNDLIKIADDLSFFSSFCNTFFNFKNNELEINQIDEKDTIFFKYKYYKNWVYNYKNYKKYLIQFPVDLRYKIEKLKDRNCYQFLSSEIHNYISRIELENLDMISAVGKFYPLCRNYNNLEEEIRRLNSYKEELFLILKYEEKYKIVPLNEKEKEKYKEDIEKQKILINNDLYEIKF